MQPSQQGRNNAGRPNPRANNSSLNPPSSTFPRDSQASSSSQVNADNSWYYPGGSSVQSSDSSASSSSDMIGPTPAFYDPAAAARQADTAAQYQQWLDSFGGQQQNVQAYQGSHHNQVYPQQPAHHQQQYPYTQGQSYQSHYPHGTASMTSQQGGMQTGDATQFAPQQQQVNDPYNDYYSTTQQSGTGTHNPDSGYSYSTSTNPPSYNTFTATPPQHPQPQGGHGQVPQHPQASGGGGTGHHFPTNPGAFPADTLHSGPQINRSTSNPPSASPTTNTWADDPYSSGQSSFTVGTGSSSSLSGAVPTISNPSTSTNPSPSQQPRQAPTATETTPTRQKRPAPQASSKPSTSTQQAPQASTTGKNKRRRKNPAPAPAAQETTLYTFDGSDSDSDDEQGGISVGMGGLGVVSSTGGRNNRFRPGACTHCKKLKMKCDFPPGDNTCRRCKTSGHVCIVEGRKPRTAPNKREYLLAQIRQKDAIIESLLKQLHNPYIATPMSIASYRMATSPSDSDNKNVRAWLDRLETSVSSAGGSVGPEAFSSLRGPTGGDEDDSDNEESSAQPADDDDQTVGPGADEEKLTSLPDTHVPLGLIANLSLTNNKSKSSKKDQKDLLAAEENLDDDDVGVANETYFMPGPATDLKIRATLIEQHSPPDILVHGLVTPEDVDKLFELFYQYINPFVHLLDPVLHTPSSTFARCPFLFTVICAISSRYYSQKSEIYPIAMHFAKHSAANALIDGWKSVELCQAYILMSIYAVPARRWEEDRSWLYTGLAIRIATDLNLHQVPTTKPQDDKHEREILNRTRVWMICFNLDRSTATQFGKPSTIKEDYIVRNSKEWYKKSKNNLHYDVHLCAYSALLRIMTKAHEDIFSDPSSPTGLNKRVDFRTVTMQCDAELTAYHEEWSKRFAEESSANDPGSGLRCRLLPFLVEYHRLVMFSFAFQQAYQRGMQPGDQVYFTKCQESAKSVIRTMIESLAPSDYMRYAPDGHFIFASFASAFLLKLLRKEFASLLTKDQETEIFDLIGRLIQTLSSPKIAIDDRHTPKLYARFLAGLLSKHRREGTVHVGRLAPNAPSGSAGAPSHLPSSAGPSTSSFSVNPGFANTSMPGQSGGSYSGAMDSTPMYDYQSDATVPTGMGQINFGNDLGLAAFGGGIADEEMLATMQAINGDAWWNTMMMPGFSWPESQSPSSNGSSPQHPSSNGYSSPSPPRPYTDTLMPNSHGYGSGVGHYQPVPTVVP